MAIEDSETIPESVVEVAAEELMEYATDEVFVTVEVTAEEDLLKE